MCHKDAMDLLQGHYIVSLSRDMAPTTKAAGLETYVVRIHHVVCLKFMKTILLNYELCF